MIWLMLCLDPWISRTDIMSTMLALEEAHLCAQSIIHDVERINDKRLRRTMQQGQVGETTRIVLDARRVSREFGWRPETSLLSGVRKTWEWIQTVAHQESAVE